MNEDNQLCIFSFSVQQKLSICIIDYIFSYTLAVGCQQRFWTERICKCLLASFFPQLYSIAAHNEAMLFDYFQLTERGIVWESIFVSYFYAIMLFYVVWAVVVSLEAGVEDKIAYCG
ncbi:hypothetical protein U1Q18_033432 [Sarracenia purpurea var. burkii]